MKLYIKKAAYPDFIMPDQVISIEEKINFYLEQPSYSSDKIHFTITMMRKAEISGNLYASYDDSWRPLKNSPFLSQASIEAFLHLSLQVYQATHDYRLLNGILKVSSGCLVNPPYKASAEIFSAAQDLIHTVSLP